MLIKVVINAMQRCYVDVRLPPSIVKQPQDKTYAGGEVYKLECTAVATPHPDFTWMKDGVEITSWPSNVIVDGSIVIDGEYSGTITFTEIYAQDQGT